MPRQAIVVGIALVAAHSAVLVVFQPERIGGDGGGAATGRAAQDALARGVVEVLFLVAAAHVPLGQVVQQIVAEGGRGAAGGAAGHIMTLGH